MGRDRQARRRVWLRRFLRLGGLAVAAVVLTNVWVLSSGWNRLYRAGAEVPEREVALVLGTSKRRENGRPNLFFQGRIEAAAELFRIGRVHHLLVSGDNRSPFYNEPRDMKAALVAHGVPESAITCDFAGLRTLDSVVRAKEAFGLKRCVIVSDGWHIPRALFVARKIGLDAIGAASTDRPIRDSLKARSREWLARVLVVVDVHVLGTRPARPTDGSEERLGERFAGVGSRL